ncbi:WD40 repeat domain-containing protein [Streptomyces olivaceoviridis]
MHRHELIDRERELLAPLISRAGTGRPVPRALLQGGEVDSVAALQGSEIVLLTVDGRLARVDAADAAVHTRPFLVHPSPNWTGLGASDEIFVRGQLIARPGHPGQVAAVTRTGTLRGEILLWDVRAPRRSTTLTGPTISVPYSTGSLPSALAFNADGSHLAVQHTDGQMRVWDVDRRKQLAYSVPFSGEASLVGIGPDDSVILYAEKQVQIYDLTGDDASAPLPVTDGDWMGGFVRGHRLTIENGSLRQTFDLRPDTQFRTLCAAAGRDYTKAERKLLPEGTPSKPPCICQTPQASCAARAHPNCHDFVTTFLTDRPPLARLHNAAHDRFTGIPPRRRHNGSVSDRRGRPTRPGGRRPRGRHRPAPPRGPARVGRRRSRRRGAAQHAQATRPPGPGGARTR